MFLCTSDFVDALKELQKRKKAGYSTCAKDIRYALSGRSFDEIWQLKDKLKDYPPSHRLIKLYVRNSGQNLIKQNGFRLIMLLNKDKELITFLYVYPNPDKLEILNPKLDIRISFSAKKCTKIKSKVLKKFKDFF